MDLIAYVPRSPRPGETLHGRDFHQGFGGKGANQAVMAAKMGADTTMVSAVGADGFGQQTLANFAEVGVDTQHVAVHSGVPTGVAPITVTDSGANSIIIVAGANARVDEEQVQEAAPALCQAGALLTQLEVPLPATLTALQACPRLGAGTGAAPVRIFNPAPAPETRWQHASPGPGVTPATSASLRAAASAADIFSPNETELENLLGRKVDAASPQSLLDAGAALFEVASPRVLLVTLGAQGVLLMARGPGGALTSALVPAPKVPAVVDTSGAGDCFMGALGAILAGPAPRTATGTTLGQVVFGGDTVDLHALTAATSAAARIASISVTARGTQASYPAAGDAQVQGILADLARALQTPSQ